MYGLRYKGQYADAIARELDGMLAAVRAWVTVDHNEDGTHREITDLMAETLAVTGPTTLGGALALDGAVSQARTSVYEVTLTGTTDDLADNGQGITQPIIRCDMAANRILTGLVPVDPLRWCWKTIVNVSGFTLTFGHNTGSAVTNRFAGPNGGDYNVLPGAVVSIVYDPGVGNWRVGG